MLRSILVICILSTTPVAVYSAATWPDAPKVDLKAREQRKQFFEDLAERQIVRRASERQSFDGTDHRRYTGPR